ncbi:MAG: DUF438 domain-containing protein [Thermoplasmatota archaeon]
MSVDSLAEKLKKLAWGEISEEEALDEVKDASPIEISEAEQKLLDEGMSQDRLQEFCKIHLKAVQEKVDKLKEDLEPGHPIKTLIMEHDEILKSLEQLESIRDEIKEDMSADVQEKLIHHAEHLVEAEKHHTREEDAIFPRMEKLGITGPTRIMKREHENMWPKKKRLLELAKDPEGHEVEIMKLIDYLVFNLRDHIFKENNILYPSALNELKDWDTIKNECDEIGYCCFTPEKEGK